MVKESFEMTKRLSIIVAYVGHFVLGAVGGSVSWYFLLWAFAGGVGFLVSRFAEVQEVETQSWISPGMLEELVGLPAICLAAPILAWLFVRMLHYRISIGYGFGIGVLGHTISAVLTPVWIFESYSPRIPSAVLQLSALSLAVAACTTAVLAGYIALLLNRHRGGQAMD